MLTNLERRMLEFIGNYLREHSGRAPTILEIGQGCGVKSVGTVHRYLKSIETKGYLERARSGWRTLLAPNELPFVGKIAAGRPLEAIEQAEAIDLVSQLIQPDCFVLQVDGDSMDAKGIQDGDYIVVKRSESAKNGEIVVALVSSEATLKEYRRVTKGARIELIPHSHNPEHSKQIYDAEQVQIQGVLTGVVRTKP
nr:transcriptional repressor LexA [Hyphomonas sp. Mor2]